MPYVTYQILSVTADTTPGPVAGTLANRNNIAVAQFISNDAAPPVRFHTVGDDLTDAILDAWARQVILSLNSQLASSAAITKGVVKAPAALDAKQQAILKAKADYDAAARLAYAKQLAVVDPDALTAYETLLAAVAAK